MKRLAITAAIVLLAGACSGSSDDGLGTPDLGTDEPGDAPVTSAESGLVEHGPPADDQIVIISGAGDLIVVASDGSAPVVIGEAGEGLISSPVWAPDGARIAWTEVAPGAFGAVDSSLVTANVDGTDPTRITTPFASIRRRGRSRFSDPTRPGPA